MLRAECASPFSQGAPPSRGDALARRPAVMPHLQTQPRAVTGDETEKDNSTQTSSKALTLGDLPPGAASTGRDARAWARLGVASAPPASLAAAHRDNAAEGLHEPLTPAAPTAPSQMTTVAQRLQVRLQSHDTEAERREVRQWYPRTTARIHDVGPAGCAPGPQRQGHV